VWGVGWRREGVNFHSIDWSPVGGSDVVPLRLPSFGECPQDAGMRGKSSVVTAMDTIVAPTVAVLLPIATSIVANARRLRDEVAMR
jgi:hypothetical protein